MGLDAFLIIKLDVDDRSQLIYWRKANQIHRWFVQNVQNGEDDCGEYCVTREQLEELLQTCTQVLEKRDSTLLPPISGFFFGSTEIDEYYWKNIEFTVDKLNSILDNPKFKKYDFFYSSSW